MVYRPSTTGATGPAFTLTGRNIAHAGRSVPELSFVGARLNPNRITITDATVKQCAALVGVCVPYVAAAIAIIDDPDVCNAVLRGDLNILDSDEIAWPEPDAGDEDDDPLFDSTRDYVEQIDRYKEHQGKPTERRGRGAS